jgi:hypothetical protein
MHTLGNLVSRYRMSEILAVLYAMNASIYHYNVARGDTTAAELRNEYNDPLKTALTEIEDAERIHAMPDDDEADGGR